MKKTLLIQLDGVSYDTLLRAVKQKYMPFVRQLIEAGWQITPVTTGLPSTTPASQIKLLYGLNNLVVGFRFMLKDQRRIFRSFSNEGVQIVEKLALELQPEPLLKNGTAIMSIFSGGATNGVSFSRMRETKKVLLGLLFFFLNPISALMTLTKILVLFIIERAEYKSKSKEAYFMHGHLLYIMKRIANEVVMTDYSMHLTKKAIKNGSPIIYVDFAGYDEIAHHYGTRSRFSDYYLTQLDGYIRRCFEFVEKHHSGHEIIILSDHGQTESRPVTQLLHQTLEQKIASIYRDKIIVAGQGGLDTRYQAGVNLYLFYSGGLALVYDTKNDKQLMRTQLEESYPDFCELVSLIDGVGHVITREDSELIVTRKGHPYKLNDESTWGQYLFVPPEKRRYIVNELKRLMTSNYAPDALIVGDQLAEDEVVSFEHQLGTHGAYGGPQDEAFMLSNHLQPGPIVGYENLHPLLWKFIHEQTTAQATTNYADSQNPTYRSSNQTPNESITR